MTGEAIFSLVKSLSKQEKINFSQFIGQSKRNTDYYTLYKTLLAGEEYDDEKVRSKCGLQSSSKYFKLRNVLGEKIILSLVNASSRNAHTREFISEAIERNVFSLASEKMIQEVETSQKLGDLDYLYYLHSLKSQVQEAFQIAIDFPEQTWTKEKVTEMLNQQKLAKDTFLQLKVSLKNLPSTFEADFRLHEKALNRCSLDIGYGGYILRKAKSTLAFLQGGTSKSFEFQSHLVEYLKKEDFHFRKKYLLKEFGILILFSSILRKDNTCQKLVLEFSAIQVTEECYLEEKNRILTMVLLQTSSNLGKFDFAVQGYKRLEENLFLFRESEAIILSLIYAKTLFVFGEFSECSKTIVQIRSKPKGSWEKIEWNLALLSFLSHLENGNWELLDSLFLKLTRAAKKSSLRYPNTVTKFLGKAYLKPLHEFGEIWGRMGPEINNILSDPQESLFADAFDIRKWAEAHCINEPLHLSYYQSGSNEGQAVNF